MSSQGRHAPMTCIPSAPLSSKHLLQQHMEVDSTRIRLPCVAYYSLNIKGLIVPPYGKEFELKWVTVL